MPRKKKESQACPVFLQASKLIATTPNRLVVVGLKRPQFAPAERTELVSIRQSTLWQKLRLTAHSEIAYLTLSRQTSDDFRSGWVECFAFLDDVLQGLAGEDIAKKLADKDSEYIGTMQGEEDEP